MKHGAPLRVGLVGCGAISEIYMENAKRFSSYFRIVACADIDAARAGALGAKHGCRGCGTVDELLHDPEIDIVLNLTVPVAHAEVTLAALQAGKHVYSEKPLALTAEDAQRILDLAAESGLRVGCAPDTFLGGSHQAARAAIDEGVIGEVIGGCGFMLTAGVEMWHPNPEFFYKHGGGPLFDMGPYYLTALVNMLGPVRRVCASAQTHIHTRTITSQPRAGQEILVEVPTHVAAVLDFAGGATVTLTTSFEVQTSSLPNLELFGTKGSMQVPDPNFFGGHVRTRRAGQRWWRKLRHRRAYTGNDRVIGLADMADAIRAGRPHRASGELARHVVEVMEAIHTSSAEKWHVEIGSGPERPAALGGGMFK